MSERENVTRGLRRLALFVVVPASTIGGVLAFYSYADHWLHASAFAVLTAACLFLFVRAPQIAAHFVPENA